jgi:uncharacterized membrane protein YbhN (UPF0104 family)
VASPPLPPRFARLRSLAPWLAFAAALLATAALTYLRRDDLAPLANLTAFAIAALTLQQIAYLLAQSGRFHVVIRRFTPRGVGFWAWAKLFVLGRFINLFVPQGGNVYRAVALHRGYGVAYRDFLTAFVNAPWLATILNLTFGAVVVIALSPTTALAGMPLWVWLAALAVAATLAPFVALLALRITPRRHARVAALHAHLSAMVGDTLASLRDGRYLARVLAWTLISLVQATAMIAFAFAALGSSIDVAAAIAFYVLLQLATYFPITPGNLGVQEVAFGALSVGFGSAPETGALVSAVIRVTGVAALIATALPWGGIEAVRIARRERVRAGVPSSTNAQAEAS